MHFAPQIDMREDGRGTSERPRTMRAARVIAPRRVEVDEVPLPCPGPTQVRIRIQGCGVCGSNLALWQGRPWFTYPLERGATGHEGWGEVDAIGESVHGVSLGQRVAFLSGHAFAEYDVADAAQITIAPSSADIFPGEAIGCAVNVMRRSAIQSGQTVAVVGVGFLGALLVQMAVRQGARVIAISRRPFALTIARQYGAHATIPFGETDAALAQVRELTGNGVCERVIEAAGEQLSLDLASALTGEQGRLIIAGYHQDAERRVNMQLWNWRGIDVVNAHERDPRKYVDAMREAARMIENGALHPSALYTHSFPLERLGDGFNLMEERPAGFLKGWIRTAA
jgi:threonine dehydrogenase-like Zn-dependent dehydrogenase